MRQGSILKAFGAVVLVMLLMTSVWLAQQMPKASLPEPDAVTRLDSPSELHRSQEAFETVRLALLELADGDLVKGDERAKELLVAGAFLMELLERHGRLLAEASVSAPGQPASPVGRPGSISGT